MRLSYLAFVWLPELLDIKLPPNKVEPPGTFNTLRNVGPLRYYKQLTNIVVETWPTIVNAKNILAKPKV